MVLVLLAAVGSLAAGSPPAAQATENAETCGSAKAFDGSLEEAIEMFASQGLDAVEVSGGGGHPPCPLPKDCGPCPTGGCGPIVFPPQCVLDDLGDGSCSLGSRTVKVCNGNQTIHVNTCQCKDVSPCICGNRVTVTCQ